MRTGVRARGAGDQSRRPPPSSRRERPEVGAAQLAQRLLALVGLEPVEEQDAVEVVDLVLEHPAQAARRPR